MKCYATLQIENDSLRARVAELEAERDRLREVAEEQTRALRLIADATGLRGNTGERTAIHRAVEALRAALEVK